MPKLYFLSLGMNNIINFYNRSCSFLHRFSCNIYNWPVVFFKNSLSNENILDLIFQNPDFDPNIIINGFNIFNIIPKKFHYKILMLPQLILPENLSQEKINIQISFDEYRDFKGIQPLIM